MADTSHHRDELCEAILKYHWEAHEANSKAQRLYEMEQLLSPISFWPQIGSFSRKRQLACLRYSHDHTSVFVPVAEHDDGMPMLKWVVCKPLGGDRGDSIQADGTAFL